MRGLHGAPITTRLVVADLGREDGAFERMESCLGSPIENVTESYVPLLPSAAVP